jgi:hypothetical protein
MIRYSYLINQLKVLREAYGAENVKVNKGNTLVLIRNFKLPPKYGMESTAVLAEIPEGYGYGIEILNTFILLDRKTARNHLFEIKDLSKTVSEQFPFMKQGKGKVDRKPGWFWICVHFWGSTAFDAVRGARTAAVREKSGVEEDGAVLDASLTGLPEHLKIIRCVLKSLSDRDQATVAEVRRMNRDREQTEQDMKKLIHSFVFDNNWRVMRWMH